MESLAHKDGQIKEKTWADFPFRYTNVTLLTSAESHWDKLGVTENQAQNSYWQNHNVCVCTCTHNVIGIAHSVFFYSLFAVLLQCPLTITTLMEKNTRALGSLFSSCSCNSWENYMVLKAFRLVCHLCGVFGLLLIILISDKKCEYRIANTFLFMTVPLSFSTHLK